MRLSKTVLPQHTDHAGVMWHGCYVSWLEEQRIEIFSKAGLDYFQLSSSGLEFPVISLKINYKIPLNHGDDVVLESTEIYKKGVRIIWLTNFLKSGVIEAATSRVELALVRRNDKSFEIMRTFPPFIQEAFDKIQCALGD